MPMPEMTQPEFEANYYHQRRQAQKELVPEPLPIPEYPDDGWDANITWLDGFVASGAVTSPLQQLHLTIADLKRQRDQARFVALAVAVIATVALVAMAVSLGGG